MPALRRRRVCGLVADAVAAAGMPRPGDLVRVATWRLDAGHARRRRRSSPPPPAGRTTPTTLPSPSASPPPPERRVAASRPAWSSPRRRCSSAATKKLPPCLPTSRARRPPISSGSTSPTRGRSPSGCISGAKTRRWRSCRRRSRPSTIKTWPTRCARRWPSCSPRRRSLRRRSKRPAPARRPAEPELPSRRLRRLDRAGDLGFAGGGDRGRTAWIRGARGDRLDDPVPARGPVHRPRTRAVRGRASCEAEELAARGYDAAVAAQDADVQANFAVLAGLTAVHLGRLVTAVSHFREAAAVNREINDVAGLRWALGGGRSRRWHGRRRVRV